MARRKTSRRPRRRNPRTLSASNLVSSGLAPEFVQSGSLLSQVEAPGFQTFDTGQRYVPEFESQLDTTGQAGGQQRLPDYTREVPGGTLDQGGTIAEPSWEPSSPQVEIAPIVPSTRFRGGGSGSVNQVGGSKFTRRGKSMRQLIDPQLWRLADGGSVPAMHELHRRGPGHYLPARPNPSEKCPFCKGSGYAGPLGDTCERCEGSGWLSVETCDGCRKKVRGGTIETSQGDWVCGSCYDQEQGISRDRFGYRVRRNPAPRSRRNTTASPGEWKVFHADHGISAKQMEYIKKFLLKQAPQGFFIKQYKLPKSLGTVTNAMYGPAAGDRPVSESKVHYMDRAGRGWEDRMVDLPPRPVNYGQVIGVRDGDSFTLYTVYGGPLSPQNPADPGNQDVAGSKKFWKQHALSSHQWAAAKPNPRRKKMTRHNPGTTWTATLHKKGRAGKMPEWLVSPDNVFADAPGSRLATTIIAAETAMAAIFQAEERQVKAVRAFLRRQWQMNPSEYGSLKRSRAAQKGTPLSSGTLAKIGKKVLDMSSTATSVASLESRATKWALKTFPGVRKNTIIAAVADAVAGLWRMNPSEGEYGSLKRSRAARKSTPLSQTTLDKIQKKALALSSTRSMDDLYRDVYKWAQKEFPGVRKKTLEAATVDAIEGMWRMNPRKKPRRARNNTTASPSARGFTFMHAMDGDEWADWALSRQGIPHRSGHQRPRLARKNGKGMSPAVAGFMKHGAQQERVLTREEEKEEEKQETARRRRIAAERKARGAPRKRSRLPHKAKRQEDQKDAEFLALVRGNRRGAYREAQLLSRGSGSRGGYSAEERADLLDLDFLKPEMRSWPVADPAHAKIALEYMSRGFGNVSEYPMLIMRLAQIWPPTPKNKKIWGYYSKNRTKIGRKCGCKMPSLKELKRQSSRTRRS